MLKSGTNEFHGTAFEFFRNDVLDAENYFQNYFNAPGAARRKKDGLRQNQYGGVLSRPIIIPKLYNGKDKTFLCSIPNRGGGGSRATSRRPIILRSARREWILWAMINKQLKLS